MGSTFIDIVSAQSDVHRRNVSDEKLLAAYCAGGDADALSEIIRRYAPLVYASACRQMSRADAADDVMQHVFMALARRAREIRSASALGPWLLRATRYTAANQMKTEQRRRRHETVAGAQRSEAAAGADPSAAAIAVEEERKWAAIRPVLDEAISRLAPADQTALVLRFFRGLKLGEVADAVGTTEEAARKRVGRAVDRLRKQLVAFGVGPAAGNVEQLVPLLAIRAIHPVPSASGIQITIAAARAAGQAGPASAGLAFKGGMAMAGGAKIVAGVAAAAILMIGTFAVIRVAGGGSGGAPGIAANFSTPVVTPPKPPPTATVDWHERFVEAYRLADNEAAKYVPTPFIPERRMYCEDLQRQVGPGSYGAFPYRFVFEQQPDGSIERWLTYGRDTALENAQNLARVLRVWQFQGDPTLLEYHLPGDWVVRPGATPEQVLPVVADALSERLGFEVVFSHRREQNDVVVVSGQVRNGARAIHLRVPGEWLDAYTASQHIPFHGSGDRKWIMDYLTNLTNLHFLLDPPPRQWEPLEVDAKATTTDTQTPRQSEDELLRQLAEQTGLQFTRARRLVDIWTLLPKVAIPPGG